MKRTIYSKLRYHSLPLVVLPIFLIPLIPVILVFGRASVVIYTSVVYKTISASEAASLLELHIKTAQDFLDGLVEIDILKKQQVFERKRPYFRYTLK